MSDLVQLLSRATSNQELELLRSILEENRKAKEAELATKETDLRLKEVELAIMREKQNHATLSAEIQPFPTNHLPTSQCSPAFSALYQEGQDSMLLMTQQIATMPPSHQSLPELSREPLHAAYAQNTNMGAANSASYLPSLIGRTTPPYSFEQAEEEIDEYTRQDFELFGNGDNFDFLDDLLARISEPSLDDPLHSSPAPSTTSKERSPAACVTLNGDPVRRSSPLLNTRDIRTPVTPITVPSAHTEPAGARSAKRNAVPIAVSCRVCSGPIAHCQLHGTKEQVTEFVADMACVQCANWNDVKSRRQSKQKQRHLDVAPQDSPITCDICKRISAAGGFRLGSHDTWISPTFAVEFNCSSCQVKYALCSDCGGGGKYRTGKWRPVQMFAPGRATCSLDHIRYAGIKTQVHVWRVRHDAYPYPALYADTEDPEVPTWALMQAIRKCSFGIGARMLMTPTYMETNQAIQTWEQVNDQLDHFSEDAFAELNGIGVKSRPPFLGPPNNGDPCLVRTYVTVRWIEEGPETLSHVIWNTITPENVHSRLPSVTAYALVDWHMATGVLIISSGGGSSPVTISGMVPRVAVIERILQDWEEMDAKAKETGLKSCPRPKYFQVTQTVFNDKKVKDVWKKRGYQRLEDVPDCPWTPEMDRQSASSCPRPVHAIKQFVQQIADVDELLAFCREDASSTKEETSRARKRGLKL
ncbi:hypothetical protein DFJ77DRAFT_17349 [Powellomyces hirtus]|nr:hypothetical protein DFJ77DRAFT_17349 [Powellomyces hirtus]